MGNEEKTGPRPKRERPKLPEKDRKSPSPYADRFERWVEDETSDEAGEDKTQRPEPETRWRS